MSLILEALKKSEAERRLGQAPGLMTPMPSSRAKRRIGPMPVVVLVSLALGIGGASWWFTRNATNPKPGGATTASSAASQSNAPALATPAPASEATAVRPVQALRPSDREETEGESPTSPDFASTERESAPVPAATVAIEPRPSSAQPASAVARPSAPQTTAPTPAQTSAPIAVLATESTAATMEAPPPVEVAPTNAALPDVPRLDQLPSAERDALPPLKLSMHVYAESAPNRFVLIDGRRFREGEKLAATLQVIEIRREGVVLDFNGRRFLLLRP